MIAHSSEARITSVVVRISVSIGATLLILLALLAIVRPDMMPTMPSSRDIAAIMHRIAFPW